MSSFMDRAIRAFNVLRGNEGPSVSSPDQVTSISPFNNRFRYETGKSVLAPIKTRLAIDASNIPIKHVLVDEYGNFKDLRESELNDRLTLMANVDQTRKAFIQDAVMTMLDEGVCAMVPIEVSSSPNRGTFDILSMRVGTIVEWFNHSVTVEVYNELTGNRKQITVPKSFAAISYNPLYPVMNEANSTLRRLVDKLALLDSADGQLYSRTLDLIIQLPYVLKTDKRKEEAARRLEALEEQLYDRKYGIGYIDPTEKVTQLNRPVTNGLSETVNDLTESLHNQLGLTPTIFSGTASPEEMIHYNNRTVLPIVQALIESMNGAFFSRTAIRQGSRVLAFPNLFKMAPLTEFSEAADKLTRNAIMSSNEIRAIVGLKPSNEPDADALRNKNLNQSDNQMGEEDPKTEEVEPKNEIKQYSNGKVRS